MQEAAPALADGRYRLLRVLGAGGMATVYEAGDTRLGVRRAIKVLDPGLFARQGLRARFEAEARTMARLSHRHIVTVHDVGVDGNRAYIVMEFIDGGSLADWTERHGAVAPRQALAWTAAALEALDVAHGAGVVHRDFKPQNLLLSRDGAVKLADFGIAQITATDDERRTRTGMTMGTLAYMAPEQKADAKNVGPAADIYAAGCTLYALLTAASPHDLYVPEVRRSAFAPLPPVVAEVLERATGYAPGDRFISAAEMRGAVLAAIERLPLDPVAFSRPGSDGAATQDASDPTWFEGHAPEAPRTDPTYLTTMPDEAPMLTTEPRSSPGGWRWVAAAVAAAGVSLCAVAGAAWWAWSSAPVEEAAALALSPAAQGAVSPGEPVLEPAPPPAAEAIPPTPSPVPERSTPSNQGGVPRNALPQRAVAPAAPPMRAAPMPAPVVRADPAVAVTATKVEAAPSRVEADAPRGRIRVSATTPSTLVVDGEELGPTPYEGTLTEGKHRVVLRPNDGRPEYKKSITVETGRTLSYCHDFEANAPCL